MFVRDSRISYLSGRCNGGTDKKAGSFGDHIHRPMSRPRGLQFCSKAYNAYSLANLMDHQEVGSKATICLMPNDTRSPLIRRPNTSRRQPSHCATSKRPPGGAWQVSLGVRVSCSRSSISLKPMTQTSCRTTSVFGVVTT